MSQNSPGPGAQWCATPPVAAPPQERRQLVGGPPTPRALCHLRWRPLVLTGLLRQVLIHHFGDPNNIEDPDLKRGDLAAIWRNALSTGIMIESVHRWRPELTAKRPAILVKRNAYRNLRVLMGDRFGPDGQGNEHYVTLWVGSHTLFCVHGTGASCELLATEVQRELTQFGPVLVEQLGLHRLQVTEVGEIGEVEESTQNFAIPITVGWCYEETWKLEPEALTLMGINFELGALLVDGQ